MSNKTDRRLGTNNYQDVVSRKSRSSKKSRLQDEGRSTIKRKKTVVVKKKKKKQKTTQPTQKQAEQYVKKTNMVPNDDIGGVLDLLQTKQSVDEDDELDMSGGDESATPIVLVSDDEGGNATPRSESNRLSLYDKSSMPDKSSSLPFEAQQIGHSRFSRNNRTMTKNKSTSNILSSISLTNQKLGATEMSGNLATVNGNQVLMDDKQDPDRTLKVVEKIMALHPDTPNNFNFGNAPIPDPPKTKEQLKEERKREESLQVSQEEMMRQKKESEKRQSKNFFSSHVYYDDDDEDDLNKDNQDNSGVPNI